MKSSMGLRLSSPGDSPLFDLLAGVPAARAIGSVSHTAARHGVSALLADRLAALGQPVPDELARDARSQVAQGLKMKRLTLQVLDALGEEGVTPILLKGFGLAVRLYPEQPLARPSSDVDVLVSKPDLTLVERAMTRLGLSRYEDPGLADVFEEHHHISFVGAAGLVEVHFRLIATLGRGGFDDVSIHARARDFVLEGRAARVLDEEDEFLYLATHAANHAFLRASWLVDLQRYLARAERFDWPRMAARSRSAGFHTAVATALELVEQLLKVRIPDAPRRAFHLGPLRRAVDRRLFAGPLVESAAVADHRVGAFLVRLWLVDSPLHGVRHLLDGARRFIRRNRMEG
ncbi:MAG: nucleotidyltransferase family protein [Myxococcota bacterium]